MSEPQSYVEILNKLVLELQTVLIEPPPLGKRPIPPEVKATIEQKLEDIKTKVLPVAEKTTALRMQDIIDAQSVTCYGNLSYCCAIKREGHVGKDCPWRDAARAGLHISDKVYTSKEEVLWFMLEQTDREIKRE